MISILSFLLNVELYLKRILWKKSRNHVVFCSENFVIVEKQADLKINSNLPSENTLQTFLRTKYPDLINSKLTHEFYFPHRIDFATSGLVCIPKTKEACQLVCDAFSKRSTRKYYIAIVRGLMSVDILDINMPIGEDLLNMDNHKMCVLPRSSKGKTRSAQTVIIKLEEGIFENFPATKLLCRPITGRRHQIRVHLSHLGHTIVGDYTYSNRKDQSPSRMYLHSFRLMIPNRIENIDVSTDDPFDDWMSVKRIHGLSTAFFKLDEFCLDTLYCSNYCS